MCVFVSRRELFFFFQVGVELCFFLHFCADPQSLLISFLVVMISRQLFFFGFIVVAVVFSSSLHSEEGDWLFYSTR